MKSIGKAGLTGLVGTTAVATAAVLGLTTSTGHAESSTSSAYGVAAQGPVAIPPSPSLESTDGSRQEKTEAEIPGDPLLNAKLGQLMAGNSEASVQLVDLAVLELDALPAELTDGVEQLRAQCQNLPEEGTEKLPEELTEEEVPLAGGVGIDDLPADSLQQVCDLVLSPGDSLVSADVVEASCSGTSGSSRVTGLKVSGVPVDVSGGPNSKAVPENPLLDITMNRQKRNNDGSFTVDALAITIAGEQEITVGSATCGGPVQAQRAPQEAPKPTPVPARVPVTG